MKKFGPLLLATLFVSPFALAQKGESPLRMKLNEMQAQISEEESDEKAGVLELSQLPMPRNYDEALATHEARSRLVWKKFLETGEYKLPASDFKSLFFGQAALSAALLKDKEALARVSEVFATTTWQPPLTGTGIKIPVLGCKRDGDYDFLLQYFVAVAMLDLKAGETLLTDGARDALEKKFLYETGGEPKSLTFTLQHCGKHKDTENHVLMTEAARYLTNQWLHNRGKVGETPDQYDNAANGLEKWLTKHLAEFLVNEFDEYNSKTYEGYAIKPFQILASFAENENIRKLSAMVLDHISAKHVTMSIAGQRHVPFRRRDTYRNNTDFFMYDTMAARHAILLGHYPFLQNEKGIGWEKVGRHRDALWGSLPGYFPPKAIVNAILQEQRLEGYQTFSHYNAEVSYKSRSFLLSGGGYFLNWWGWFTIQNHGWARPATVIPADSSYSAESVIRFKGNRKEKKRTNLCVHENFMCGLNPEVPEHLEVNKKIVQGNWMFFDLKANFFVALWQGKKGKDGFGVLEAREASELSFDDFVAQVLSNNPGSFNMKGTNSYTTTKGKRLEFVMSPKKLHYSNISAIDGVPQEIDTKKWNLASGFFYNQIAEGYSKITGLNGETLVLDSRDPFNPERISGQD